MSSNTRSTLFLILLALPLAFVAGIAAMALMARTGVVSVHTAHSAYGESTRMANENVSNGGGSEDGALSGANNQQRQTVPGQLALINERLDELEQQLRASTNQTDLTRAQTDKKLDELTRQLEQNIASTEALSATQNDVNAIATGEQNVGFNGGFGNRGFGQADAQQQYDSLILAGVDPYLAQEIQQRSDQWSLQRLELIDQATREGWRESEQFDERLQALRDARPDIRGELGDADYDRYLYASGDSNRVAVSSIINGSAAQQSGLQNGDVVVSYANNRVFGTRELQRATRDGQRGESVQVEVLRNGQVITVDVPRGPLGVTLTGSRVDPSQ